MVRIATKLPQNGATLEVAVDHKGRLLMVLCN